MSTSTMSAQQQALKHSFHFRVSGELADFVSLRLFNGHDEVQASAYGELNADVPPGFYKLRIEFNEIMEDRIFRVVKPIEETFFQPAGWSSITAGNMASSHEYYTGPSIMFSGVATAGKKEKKPGQGSFFFFLRYPDMEVALKEKHKLYQDFYLLNEKREEVYRLHARNTKNDRVTGWMAFHAKLDPGNYSLVYAGEQAREIPVRVYSDWQTQLFMMYRRQPVFPTARFLLMRDNGQYRPDEGTQLLMDALLQKMHNGIYHVPEKMKNLAAYDKWEHPLLGIAVAYCYLLGDENKDDQLFKLILRNIEDSILRDSFSPDIVALKLLAARHFGKKPGTPLSITHPPMFLVGMNALIRMLPEFPHLLEPGSNAEKAVEKLKTDTVYTTFEPITMPSDTYVKYEESIVVKQGRKKRGTAAKGFTSASALEGMFSGADDFVAVKKIVPVVAKREEAQPFNWVTGSLYNRVKRTKGKPDIALLAAELGVTPNIVENHLRILPDFERKIREGEM